MEIFIDHNHNHNKKNKINTNNNLNDNECIFDDEYLWRFDDIMID